MSTENQNVDLSQLTDEQLMAMPAPAASAPLFTNADADEPDQVDPPAAAVVDEPAPPTPPVVADGEDQPSGAVVDPPAPQAPSQGADDKPDGGVDTEVKPDTDTPDPAAKKDEPAKTDAPPAVKTGEYSEEVGRSLFTALLASPVKANGKEIKLQSPEEAVKLVQMGLNYTKKMQTLQPALRVVTMLENNGLMDEGKLSFLIDLDKGNPQAIQKLLAEKNIDPMLFDAEKAGEYVAGNHQVTDAEMSFKAVLDDVATSDTGQALITEVTRQWDADSKQALFENPQFLVTLNEQKAVGLYDVINSEVDRLRTLGQIPPNVPFLQAYHAVGEMLKDAGRLGPKQDEPKVDVPQVPVAERVVAPTPVVKNTEQAKATAPVKANPNTAPSTVNWLAMSDAEFAAEFDKRRL